MAKNEGWRDAHSSFNQKYGSNARRSESTLLEEKLKLSDEKKYVACAGVESYQPENNQQ